MKKHLFFIPFVLIMCLLCSCSSKVESVKPVILANAQLMLPAPMQTVFTECEKNTFNYNGINISSFKYLGYDSENNAKITISTFPFSAAEYMDHYVSPFSDYNTSIEKQYEEISLESDQIKSCYYSCGKLDNKYIIVYLTEFTGKTGTLIFTLESNKKIDYSDELCKIKFYNFKYGSIKPQRKQNFENLKNYQILENLFISAPEDMVKINDYNKKTKTNRAVFAGEHGNYLYLTVSEGEVKYNTNISWQFLDGFEIVGNYAYNVNTGKLYFYNEYRKIYVSQNKTYTLAGYYFDTINQSEFPEQVFQTVCTS